MQSYVTAERLTMGGQLPSLQPLGSASAPQAATSASPDSPLIDQLLGRLADLVVDRLMARAGTDADQPADEWMDARTAAVYLGIHQTRHDQRLGGLVDHEGRVLSLELVDGLHRP